MQLLLRDYTIVIINEETEGETNGEGDRERQGVKPYMYKNVSWKKISLIKTSHSCMSADP